MKVDGACHCGSITVEGEADPERVMICHCIDCQTSTGSTFRISVSVTGATFKITGAADDLPQDHRGKRHAPPARLLSTLRHAGLRDVAR
jgi:hypothetical protein